MLVYSAGFALAVTGRFPELPYHELQKIFKILLLIFRDFQFGGDVIGNSFHGIGVPDCIKSARLAVEQITASASQLAPA